MEMLESQLEAQLSNLTLKLGAIGLSAEDQERIAQRARQDSERTAERIQEKMRRVQEKLDRKMAETQRRAEQKARAAQHRAAAAQRRAHSLGRHSWNFSWPTPPVPPEAPGESVSDEERVMILRMLEQKKITPEQADQLLTALEGKGS
jgi:dsDNA-specific endonuclease/ATPase MutS2